jgi:hypothetical protein
VTPKGLQGSAYSPAMGEQTVYQKKATSGFQGLWKQTLSLKKLARSPLPSDLRVSAFVVRNPNLKSSPGLFIQTLKIKVLQARQTQR